MVLKHLACIMDGNRRWARQHGMMPWLGHQEGMKTVEKVVDFCLEQRIPYLSLYAFSLENFKRSSQEVDFIFSCITTADIDGLCKKKVGIRFVGDRTAFPVAVMSKCEQIEQRTSPFEQLHVNVLLCYGSQQELAQAAQAVAQAVHSGQLAVEDITVDTYRSYLWSGNFPEPDLIIRTGGVKRLSNFLLFQAAYSELYFTDELWPALEKSHLQDALCYFESCKRNYGT